MRRKLIFATLTLCLMSGNALTIENQPNVPGSYIGGKARWPVPFVQLEKPELSELFNAYRIFSILKYCNKLHYLKDNDLESAQGIIRIMEIPYVLDGNLSRLKTPLLNTNELFDSAFKSVKGFEISQEICHYVYLQLLEFPDFKTEIDDRFVIKKDW